MLFTESDLTPDDPSNVSIAYSFANEIGGGNRLQRLMGMVFKISFLI
jgi:hypothetical protein